MSEKLTYDTDVAAAAQAHTQNVKTEAANRNKNVDVKNNNLWAEAEQHVRISIHKEIEHRQSLKTLNPFKKYKNNKVIKSLISESDESRRTTPLKVYVDQESLNGNKLATARHDSKQYFEDNSANYYDNAVIEANADFTNRGSQERIMTPGHLQEIAIKAAELSMQQVEVQQIQEVTAIPVRIA